MKQQIGAGHVKDIGKNLSGTEFVRDSHRLGHHRSADKEMNGVVAWSISLQCSTIYEPVAAFEYLLSYLVLPPLCQHGIE